MNKTVKYSLTASEQKDLRKVCKYTGLAFEAQAARPATARKLIADHLLAAQTS